MEHFKRYEEALCVYDSVEEFVASNYVCEVWLRQGETLEALGRFDEALKKFDDVLESIEDGLGYGGWMEYDTDAWEIELSEEFAGRAEELKERARTDSVFDFLRDDPEFKKIIS